MSPAPYVDLIRLALQTLLAVGAAGAVVAASYAVYVIGQQLRELVQAARSRSDALRELGGIEQ